MKFLKGSPHLKTNKYRYTTHCVICEKKLVGKQKLYCSFGCRYNISFEDRFFSRRIISEKGCWLFTGKLGTLGYVQVAYKGRVSRLHRVSWEHYNGKIPNGMFVLHKCDIRKCFNPRHLFLGTQLDNMRDCKQKGRLRIIRHKGEKNGMSKLTKENVIEMRKIRKYFMLPYNLIAELYNVTTMTVYRATTKKLWRHI